MVECDIMKNNKGQALVEYVLIIALISVVIIGLVNVFGGYLKDTVTKMGCEMMGKEYVETEVNKGRNKPMFTWFYPLCKYVLCPICFIVLILGALNGGIG